MRLAVYLPTYLRAELSCHFLQNYQAAVAIARTFYNVTQYSVAWSMTGGLFTQIPEAIGAGKFELLPLLTQRSLWLAFLSMLPLNALVMFVEPLVAELGQSQHVAELAAPYVQVLMLHYVFTIAFTVLKRVLQPLDLSVALSVVIVLSCVVSMASSWLFVHVFGWGYIGRLGRRRYWHFCKCWIGVLPLREVLAWREVKRYMSLTLPILLDAMVTWWSLELVIMLVSLVPTADGIGANRTAGIAGVSVFMELDTVFFYIWLGTGNAANIRVGIHVGAADQTAASAAIWVTLYLTVFLALVVNTTAGLVCFHLPNLFSNDLEVQALVTRLAWILTLTLTVGALKNHLGSVQRSLGQQKYVFYINLVATYVISLPLAVALTFPAKWRLTGEYVSSIQLILLLSLPLAQALSVAAQGWLVWRTDWTAVMHQAHKRLNSQATTQTSRMTVATPTQSQDLAKDPLLSYQLQDLHDN
eukprot:g13111.t1